VSDPGALYVDKPNVQKDCVLDSLDIATIGVSQPQNVETHQTSPQEVEISWEEPIQDGGAQIQYYRIFVNDKENLYQTLSINTPDKKTFYKLKVPQTMWGKDYTVTV